MNINMKILLATAGLSELFSGFSASDMRAEAMSLQNPIDQKRRNESKYNLTIDLMMIIGKYFKSNKDFINVMKANKKHRKLTLMYKFNPISDISLFKNMQIQHFYKPEDVKNKKEGLYQYIYWPTYDYNNIKNKKDNEIFKNVVLKAKAYELIEDGICIVPKGITRIGNNCFLNCSQLTNITLFPSLKEIGYNAFRNTKITMITIPEGITKLGNGCLAFCTKLNAIRLPASLKEIGNDVFEYTNITSIIIPEGVTKIGNFCFYYCLLLTNVRLPSSLIELGKLAFYNTNITSIKIPERVSKIGNGCFKDCSKLSNIELPLSLIEIGKDAFWGTQIGEITVSRGCKYAD